MTSDNRFSLQQALTMLRLHTEGGKNAHLVLAESVALREYIEWLEGVSLVNYIQNHINWSRSVFGEGAKTEGILAHIEKEVDEVREKPTDVVEWCDIGILAFDGAWRNTGLDANEIAMALIDKQRINMERRWPEPVDGRPTEHIKE